MNWLPGVSGRMAARTVDLDLDPEYMKKPFIVGLG